MFNRIAQKLPRLQASSAAAESAAGNAARPARNPSVRTHPTLPARTSTPGGAPAQRPGVDGLRNFFSRSSSRDNGDAAIEQSLGRYVNVGYAKELVDNAKHKLAFRHPDKHPSDAGLAAVAAYTSGGLDRKLAEYHGGRMRDSTFNKDMAVLEKTVGDTVKLLKKSDETVVRRNVALDRDALAAYRPGSTVQFDRITSVTLKPHQTYTGGNVDFVIETRDGVASVDALSVYSSAGRGPGENEGILDPGSAYEVVGIRAGKEDGTPSNDPDDFPPVTIHLREKAPRDA